MEVPLLRSILQEFRFIISPKATLPYLRCVLFSVTSDCTMIIGTDLSNTLRFKLNTAIMENCVFMCPYDTLTRYLKDCKSSEISLKYDNGYLYLKSDTTFSIRCETNLNFISKFKSVPDIHPNGVYVKPEFLIRLGKSLHCTSKASDKPLLENVHINVLKDKVIIESGDTSRYWIDTVYHTSNTSLGSMLLHHKLALEIAKCKMPTELMLNKGRADTFDTLNITTAYNNAVIKQYFLRLYSDTTYVDTDSLVNTDISNTYIYVAEKNILLGYFTQALKLASTFEVFTTLEFTDTLDLSTGIPGMSNFSKTVPLTKTSDYFNITCKTKYLLESIRNIDSTDIIFSIKDQDSPITIKGINTSYKEYIMPSVKVNYE